MLRLANFSVRRPRAALAIWMALAAVLIVIGTGVAGSFSPSKVVVPGSQASRAEQLSQQQFGASVLVPILLQGPQAQLDRQGPTLVALLGKRPDTRVMSAWDAGSTGKGLRPRPDAAMIVAAVAHTEKDMVSTYQAQIESTVNRVVSGPVTAHVSGQPTIDRAMKTASVDTTRKAMFIAIPILFVLLLVGLRAPLAAAMLAAFGATTVGVAFGAMALLGKVIDTDAIAITFAALTGLSLSVGFGLMIAERFREAHAAGGDDRAASALAATTAVSTVGRAILFGGTALVVSLILAAAFSSNEVLTSVGIGSVLCSLLAIGAAVVVMPAALTLFGHRLQAGAFAAPRPLARAWGAISDRGGAAVQRTAFFSGFAATAILAAIAIPVIAIDTGPPGIANIPSSSKARQDFNAINRVMGAGWATPFNILVASKTDPITSATMLKKLDAFQTRIAKDKAVASVVGPGEFNAQTKDLGKLPKSLEDSAAMLKGGKKDLGTLEDGLGQAGAGAIQLQQGLRDAASGASQLQGGGGSAQSGADQLRVGLDAARAGAIKISDGLGSALGGANALREGAVKALSGSKQISGGLGQAAPTVKEGLPLVKQMATDVQSGSQAVDAVTGSAQSAATSLDSALANLQSANSSDPKVAAAIAAIQKARTAAGDVNTRLGAVQGKMQAASGVAVAFAGQVQELSAGLSQLLAGSTQLTSGIAQLSSGNADLATGIEALHTGGGDLTGGIDAAA